MKRTALDVLDEMIENNPELKKAYEKELAKMNKRTLTLVVEFDKEDPPRWVWEAHKAQLPLHGFCINIIAEGNQLKSDQDDEDDE